MGDYYIRALCAFATAKAVICDNNRNDFTSWEWLDDENHFSG